MPKVLIEVLSTEMKLIEYGVRIIENPGSLGSQGSPYQPWVSQRLSDLTSLPSLGVRDNRQPLVLLSLASS